MQHIMENVDLYDSLEYDVIKHKIYKESKKDALIKEIRKICSDHFTHDQIFKIVNIYFNIKTIIQSRSTKPYIFRGIRQYWFLAGIIYYICNDINLTLKLFIDYGISNINTWKISLYTTLIKRSVDYDPYDHYDFYDHASNELAMNTS
jgi:hypothetical protein